VEAKPADQFDRLIIMLKLRESWGSAIGHLIPRITLRLLSTP
jgi:hypothetical protein